MDIKTKAVPGKTAAQAEMFANRLVKRRRHLSKWARRTGAGAYLLYDRDIPEIPLKAEYFPEDSETKTGDGGGAISLSFYRRPYEKSGNEERAWLSAMKAAAAESLGLDPADIFFRERERQRGAAQYG
ncbi:MAG: rRNA (guanine-N2)-methyltransferase, partial [Treponema sp.]|nr:rRNA (guanine-N2)-methyltransferase [Treponema sp.]